MASKVTSNSIEHFENLNRMIQKRAQEVGVLVGENTVNYLKSLTDEIRPPAYLPRRDKNGKRIKTGPRKAHPGHWADVTGNLSNAHQFRMRVIGSIVEVTVYNNLEYARELNDREGYSVVSVAFDDGSVERFAQEAFEKTSFEKI